MTNTQLQKSSELRVEQAIRIQQPSELWVGQALRIVRGKGQVVKGRVQSNAAGQQHTETFAPHHNVCLLVTDTGREAKPGNQAEDNWVLKVGTLLTTYQVFAYDDCPLYTRSRYEDRFAVGEQVEVICLCRHYNDCTTHDEDQEAVVFQQAKRSDTWRTAYYLTARQFKQRFFYVPKSSKETV